MKALIYLMGKSASGKDTIYKKLISDSEFVGVKIYTTRPMRENEVDGIDYFFVDENYLIKNKDKIIEKREYNTKFGLWTYATLDDGQFDKDKILVIIGTLQSFVKCKEYFYKDFIIPIYIEVDNNERFRRALMREGDNITNKKREEIERRFKADDDDFSEEKLLEAGIIEKYKNENIKDCLLSIQSNLRRIIERI